MGITKFVLKRPITTILCVLCLVVFGFSAVKSSPLELTPEMNLPMMIVSTVYPGASPDDINELVTQPVEDAVGTLNGIKSTTSISNENFSILLLEYEYGTDMDKAYSDLKKKMDNIESDLPDDAQTPSIMEFNMNEQPSMILSVNNDQVENLYNYTESQIVPELEKLSSVASVDLSGGQKEYIRVELIPEKLNQYHLTMANVISAVSASDFSYPGGSTLVGGQDLSVTTGVEFKTEDSLKGIPITTGSGNIIYLQDVANVYSAVEDATGIGRYDGKDTISLSIKKQTSSTDMAVSKDVTRTLDRLTASNQGLDIIVVDDNSDMIKSSLTTVVETMAMAVVISMVIIFLFFGDLKASLIVGSSIPVSILSALVLMNVMGFSLNVITLSALVLGVGMMVDNSIVVLESCFRATKGVGFREYMTAALEGSGIVLQSIVGSTATTCVVFLPLAFLEGMSGQMFKPLGFTIVFCMIASLISAMTVVPLCYTMYRPKEKERAPFSAPVRAMQSAYRDIMEGLLPKKKTVMFVSVALLVFSFFLATKIKMEMMPAGDEGTISMTIDTRPGLTVEETDAILKKIEQVVMADPDYDSYMLTFGSSGVSLNASSATLTAYLKSDRSRETAQVMRDWKKQLGGLPDCSVSMEQSSNTSSMTMNADEYEVILQSTQYDELKQVSDDIKAALIDRKEVTGVHSTLENAAPLVRIDVDPIKASAEGLVPAQIGATVNQILSGDEATTLDVDGEEVSVMVEYAKGEYETMDQLKSILLPTPSGGSVALTDVADIRFKDSPSSITRKNKTYQVTVTGDLTEFADENTKKLLDKEIVEPRLTANVGTALNSISEMQGEEFASLFGAIATAVFLIFVVMAAQFESPKFSLMVMTTIPFSLIGSFGLLFLADASLSMPSLLGFLMLVGTVVNNGILYVDTVNQYRNEMDQHTALIEAGATRLRPILMTTLTTIVAMIPMAMGIGDSGEMMQGLALVDVGGLIASTVLSLLMLPIYYALLNRPRKNRPVLD